MSDKQDLSELLLTALNDIEAMGGPERAQLADLIGKKVYDGMLTKPRLASVIDRWVEASPKHKAAATKTLAIAIARHADKPELLARIERELGDAFEIPAKKAGPSPETRERAPTSAKDEKQANPVDFKIADSDIRKKGRNGQKPKHVLIAALAAGDDMGAYRAARQRIQKSEL
jgi:hypothetical protein